MENPQIKLKVTRVIIKKGLVVIKTNNKPKLIFKLLKKLQNQHSSNKLKNLTLKSPKINNKIKYQNLNKITRGNLKNFKIQIKVININRMYLHLM